MTTNTHDSGFMQTAIQLSEQAGLADRTDCLGAVVVKEGDIIGAGKNQVHWGSARTTPGCVCMLCALTAYVAGADITLPLLACLSCCSCHQDRLTLPCHHGAMHNQACYSHSAIHSHSLAHLTIRPSPASLPSLSQIPLDTQCRCTCNQGRGP
jgi:pyrimidine deaminase RibD-like protein